MGIEPTSEAWEVLNFPIPFSSQGDARPLASVNRWASKAHPVRPNSNCRLSTVSAHMVNDAAQTGCVATPTITSVGRVDQLAPRRENFAGRPPEFWLYIR